MVILWAKRGFVAPDDTLDPHDVRTTPARADDFSARLDQSVMQVAWPRRASSVLLAGGQIYRRVMRAAMSLVCAESLPIEEVSGEIGSQRSQLGRFLSGMPPQFVWQIGSHPNGIRVFRRYGPFEAGSEINLQNRATPGQPSTRVRILGLFQGPTGPTAEEQVDSEVNGQARSSTRWVGVRDMELLP